MKFEIRTELNIVVDDFWMIFDVSLKKRQWADILQYITVLKKGSWIKSNANLNFTVTETLN